jgi:hypothetical protein
VKPRPICLHCDEPITDDDIAWTPVFFGDGRVETREQHTVCAMRAMIGGLNHLRGRCACCGGTEPPDPPDMSRLEAARAAVAYFWQRNAGEQEQ